MPDTYTERLNIRKIQPTDYFISDTFNAILDDIDAKVLGIDHLETALHWTEWKKSTAYERNDVVRWVGMKSHQYAKCLTGGISGTTSPGNNVTGSVLTEGTVTWKVMSLTEATDTTGPIVLWLGGTQYSRGDVALYANALYRSKIDHTASGIFEPDEAKWTEIYSSIRPWAMNKYYYLNDTVIVGSIIYKCNTAHTSKATFANDQEIPTWTVVGNLARAMEWQPNTYYLAEQIITKNGLLYRAIETHTSDGVDFVNDSLKWDPVFASIIPWTSNAWYDQDVVVSYNNILYRCVEPHTSNANFDYSKWQLLHDPNAFIRDWVGSTHYYQNQVVRYNGNLYRCNTINNDATLDITKWTLLTDSINDWVASVDYVVGQYVNYKGSLYKCITANDDANFTASKWQKVSGGGIDTWASNNDYSVGDIVVYNNKIYSCNTGHTSGTTFLPDANKWTEISACITRIPDWKITTEYVVGDLVAHDAKIYRCLTAHTSGSTWNNAEEAKWEELSPTINEISTWTPSTDYEVGQLIIYNNRLYRCNTDHTSDSTSFNTDIAYWDGIGSSGGIESWRANEAYTTSNVVLYNNKIYKCNTAHTSGSTFDPTKWDEISSADIGLWQPSTGYKVGNVVIKDNQIYRCKTLHTSDSSDFYKDIAKWDVLDTKWQAKDWVTNTYYLENEVVLYNNTSYRCTTAHTSLGTFELDKADWEPLNANIRQWVSGTTYKVGDTVLYENELYKCITANNDNSFYYQKWKKICKCNISMWKGALDPNILALLHFDAPNELYRNEYGTSFTGSPKCIQTSALFDGCNYSLKVGDYGELRSPTYSFSTGNEVYTLEYWFRNESHWNMFNETIMMPFFDGYSATAYSDSLCVIRNPQGNQIGTFNEWQTIHIAQVITGTESTVYLNGVSLGTITRSNANADVSFYIGYSQNFTKATLDELRISAIARYTSNFTPKREVFSNPNYDGYNINDLVVYEDKIYRALEYNNDVTFTPSKWVEVSSANTPLWETNIYYAVGAIVIYSNQTYRCTTAHTSNTFLGDIANWESLDTNWLVNDWVSNKLYLENQVVSYDDGLWKCLVTHESASGDSPADAVLYESSTNVIDVNDTTTIPYSETIDLGSVKKITDFTYNEVTTDMSFTYNIETSEDNVTFTPWAGTKTNARYVKLTVDTVNIVTGATSPNAYLDAFTVIGESDNWQKISSGGADIELAKKSDVDEMFI